MKTKWNQTEKKQLGIFLVMAFAVPYLLGILMGVQYYKGNDLSIFPNAQMYYPAAGVMLAMLITRKGDAMLPKKFYYWYLLNTAVMVGLCLASPVIPAETMAGYINGIIIAGSALGWLFLLLDRKEKRAAYGLNFTGHGKRKPFLYVGLFLILYTVRDILLFAVEGQAGQLLENFRTPLSWVTLIVLPVNFFLVYIAFFGEEYGWRYFLQPLLQKRFGLKGGVVLLGLLWGIWHLPINLFYYADSSSVLQSVVGQLITCVTMGIFFGYAYLKTQNIWVPVILHFLNNNLVPVFTGSVEISGAHMTWKDVLTLLVINGVLFAFFLLTGVYREKKGGTADIQDEKKTADML